MQDDILYRLEDETLKLLDFINSMTNYPFLVDVVQDDEVSMKRIVGVINYLESLLECLIMYDRAKFMEGTIP